MSNRIPVYSRSGSLKLLLVAALLGGCASTPGGSLEQDLTTLSFPSELFGERPDVTSIEEVFSLGEVQQHNFLSFFNDPGQQEIPPHERIYEYLVATTADFDFQSDTRTAAQTLTSASGNCLSMAILTTALANLVNVDAGYQLVDSTPVFQRRGDVIAKKRSRAKHPVRPQMAIGESLRVHVETARYSVRLLSRSHRASASSREPLCIGLHCHVLLQRCR